MDDAQRRLADIEALMFDSRLGSIDKAVTVALWFLLDQFPSDPGLALRPSKLIKRVEFARDIGLSHNHVSTVVNDLFDMELIVKDARHKARGPWWLKCGRLPDSSLTAAQLRPQRRERDRARKSKQPARRVA